MDEYGISSRLTIKLISLFINLAYERVVVVSASKDFPDPSGTKQQDRAAALLSFDQEFGKVVGGWIRFGWQTNDAAVDYGAIYSRGIDIKGHAWGRKDDNIGLGIAYLSGGSLDIDASRVSEAYYRWQPGGFFGLTADVQYQDDGY
jgi:hypothetical protein